jgi:hypothetical protein
VTDLFDPAHAAPGFKGDGGDETVLHVFNQIISTDPYPREDQANFAKWYML